MAKKDNPPRRASREQSVRVVRQEDSLRAEFEDEEVRGASNQPEMELRQVMSSRDIDHEVDVDVDRDYGDEPRRRGARPLDEAADGPPAAPRKKRRA